MILYSIRSERQLMEQIHFNILYRWFVGLEMDDAVWDAKVFSKNRARLMAGETSRQLLLAVVEEARGAPAAERGALHGGWNAVAGLGQPAQLQGEA